MLLGFSVPIVAAIVMSPWVIRNYVVFERFIPFASMGGWALLQGNNRIVVTEPRYYGYNYWDSKIPEYRAAVLRPMTNLNEIV